MNRMKLIVFAEMIIWAAVILASAVVLQDTEAFGQMLLILGGGAAGTLLVLSAGLRQTDARQHS
ncbi:hypothetical protein KFU94_25765 [Chloroflexi bacterium TSY]|nr:hypothetical protein [Chloroflexi bacterium TSY]